MEEPTGAGAVNILEDNILGISEMLTWLQKKEMTKAQIYKDMVAKFDHISWSDDTQVRIRLTWLEKLGVVEKSGDGYQFVG